MPVIRLFLLLVVLGGLTLLLTQNWSPVLPLVFLGTTTQPLPLAAWILIAVAAGAFTSLFLAGLFKLSDSFARASSPRRKAPGGAQRRSEAPRTTAQPQPNTNSTARESDDDWDTDSTDDDWDFEEADKTPNSTPPRGAASGPDATPPAQNTVRDSQSYEVSDEPKTKFQSGAYSYSYREPSNSGVGRTESVYDANYRVINPPYQQTNKAQEDDDWGFEDDEIEDEGDRNPNIRR